MTVIENNTAMEPRESVRPVPALPGFSDALLGLGQMSDADFDHRLTVMARAQDHLRSVKMELMEAGIDYGKIPGTGDKHTLLLPGAQKLTRIFNLVATFHYTLESDRHAAPPFIRYEFRCELHWGAADGPVLGVGVGTCNSWEKKYRYRYAERTCPECGKATIRKSQHPDRTTGDVGWYCWQKIGGCNAKFESMDERVVGQKLGLEDNPDILDVDNTLAKMGKKRAFIDAVLIATMSSGLFSQDIGDEDNAVEAAERKRLSEQFKALIASARRTKPDAFKKNSEIAALVRDVIGVKVPNIEHVWMLPLKQLRALVSGMQDRFGVDVMEEQAEQEGGDAGTGEQFGNDETAGVGS